MRNRTFTILLIGFSHFLYGQTSDSTELQIDKITIERDRKELAELKSKYSQYLTNASALHEEIISIMQLELSQTKRKLTSARIEIGRSKTAVSNDLKEIRLKKVGIKSRKQIKADVRRLKDDQKDVRKLERYYKSQEQLLEQMSSVRNEKDWVQKGSRILEAFMEVMENDIRWTQSEISEDRMELKNKPRSNT